MGQTTIRTPSRQPPGAGAFRLYVLYGPPPEAAGVTVALGAEAITIGRAGEADLGLPLHDGEVSRRHAVVEPADGGYRVRDLQSSNGTFVGGERVESKLLTDGDVLRFGSHLVLHQFVSFTDAQRVRGRRGVGSAIVGGSIALERLRERIETVAEGRAAVLILGESGAGKELVAREIHERSGRGGPFVPVNCAALPENVIESELFGHGRGAFTGATEKSRGLFGEAENGTIFLDEIGEMPLALQPKLLRALATGEVRPVGETKPRNVDVRIVAATNVDLEDAVERGAFRGDLWARLNGARVEAPPLRARREDVIPLAEHFASAERGPSKLTPDAAEALLVHGWRYNVRELEQAIRAAAVAARERSAIDLPDLPEAVQAPIARRTESAGAKSGGVPLALRIRRDGVPTADELVEVLRHYQGSVARTAEFFGKDRKQIYRWAERLGVDPEALRSPETEGGG